MVGAALGVVLVPITGALSRPGRSQAGLPRRAVARRCCSRSRSPRSCSPPTRWAVFAVFVDRPRRCSTASIYGPLAAFWSELFDTRYRYTALSTLYQVSGIVASGLTPLIAAWLVTSGDGTLWLVAGYNVRSPRSASPVGALPAGDPRPRPRRARSPRRAVPRGSWSRSQRADGGLDRPGGRRAALGAASRRSPRSRGTPSRRPRPAAVSAGAAAGGDVEVDGADDDVSTATLRADVARLQDVLGLAALDGRLAPAATPRATGPRTRRSPSRASLAGRSSRTPIVGQRAGAVGAVEHRDREVRHQPAVDQGRACRRGPDSVTGSKKNGIDAEARTASTTSCSSGSQAVLVVLPREVDQPLARHVAGGDRQPVAVSGARPSSPGSSVRRSPNVRDAEVAEHPPSQRRR